MPELVVAGAEKKMMMKKVAGWSTKMLEEVTSRHEVEQWRSINQEAVDGLWQELSGKWRRRFWEKYKVEESKKGAYKGRGELLEWRIVKK